jgi:UDPglucose 6-dehydrogenase
VAVIGTGYVGLTTGASLAHFGHHVICADVSDARVAALTAGQIPFYEPGLAELVQDCVQSGRLSFTTSNAQAVEHAEFVFLCLPTPQGADGAADLSYVQQAAASIGPSLQPDAVVVNKSTVPVGAAQMVSTIIDRADIHVVSNPEFLREGTAVADCLQPDRVVIGATDLPAAERLAALYQTNGAPVLITDPASAETVKYAANAFLAAKLSFINSVATLCEAFGANVTDVVRGMSLDHRIGTHFMSPGPGWGGSCLPKDTAALVHMADESGYDFELLRSVIAANDAHRERLVDKIERAAGGSLDGHCVAVWGLAFKAGTDDVRESPAVAVVCSLLARGAQVRAFDPQAKVALDGVTQVGSALAATEAADVLVVLTEWPEFTEVPLPQVAQGLRGTTIVDARNLLSRPAAAAAGLHVVGIGS